MGALQPAGCLMVNLSKHEVLLHLMDNEVQLVFKSPLISSLTIQVVFACLNRLNKTRTYK